MSRIAKCPPAWLAVETVDEGHFSLESDAWSLAVTIWELFSRCETTPYEKEGWEGMQIFENLEKLNILPNNIRPSLPSIHQNGEK